ncbi:junctional cadherin 5-associated protein isoform X1 [Sminthopsis crassicaudata]|uniref:junctional cadherin 5-associated protein isoform X1 n=2 Tax=Sminthopsis crassicaudata TaxID=9301 RepID=UPI003D68D355
MYSVEDLLISHGYKLSRNSPAPHGDRYDGYQQESSDSRAGHGTLNGYEAHPTAFAYNKKSLGKGYLSDNEHNGAVSGSHRDPPNSSAFHHSKEGFYNQPPLEWSSQPKPDLAYWRRKGQDFSVLLDYTDRGNLETPRMAEPHGMNRNVREGQLEVGSRLENTMKRAVLEDSWKISRDPKWQNANFESWNQPRRLGRQMSDGDGEKLLQDVYSFTKGDNTFNSQNKGKSQSLPRVLSPDSLRCVEMPILINDYHFPGDAKMLFYPTNSTSNLEYLRNPEKGDPYIPLQKPKYGRPLKPPSYELHRQTRGGVETSRYQDNYQKDCVSFLPQTNEPRQDPYNPDPNLEPPMYVPPPSYRSPPQQNTNPHFPNEVPHFQYGGHIQQQQRLMMEKPIAGHYSSSSSYRSGNQYGASGCPPHGLSGHPQHVEACNSSVQYIPFNDPRIRHIKMTHHQDLGQQTKFLETLYTTGPSDFQSPARVQAQDDGAFLHPESQVPTTKSENDPATYAPSLGWLPAATPPDREICALPDQRDNCVLSEQQPDKGSSRQQCTKGRVSSQIPQWESTCETITKLKTFQTGIQTKKSSKKKVNETVFCLVSVPVKSEPHLPDTDRNNNDLKQNADKKNGNDKNGVLQEQSLLSMSSTDLELQALTGNMASKTELQKQGPGGPKQYKQTNDLRFSHPIKHRELRYSGSWPGDQYRDQQTQTPITQESQTSQFLPAKKMESQHDALPLAKVSDPTLKLLEPSASETLKTTASPSSDRKMRPNTCNLKGQMYFSPSSNSAFSRTASSTIPTSKAGQSQPHGASANINERDTKPVVKGQVVKGESSAPCNSKELFGQFLLKPVSRRPWDVISQLESFNKELQEQEESSSNCSRSSSSIDGEVAESEQQMQEDIGADADLKDYKPHAPTQDMRVGLQPRITAPEIPAFKSGRVKSVELISDFICDYPQAQIPLQRRDSKGESVKPLVESMIPETRKQEMEYRIDRLAISPDPGKRMMSSSLMKTAPNPSSYPTDIREPQENRQYSDVLHSIQPSQMIHSRSEGVKERESEGHISLVNKTQGLSEPEIKFVEHDMGPVQRANKLDGILEKPGAIEIPPNEPLQTRAARILGIEVAVESLIHGNKDKGPNLPPGTAENIPKADFPAVERSYNVVQPNPPEPTSSKSAFDSRRKCGWTESPLFVGDRDTHLKTRVIHQDSELNPDGNGDDTSNSLVPELEPKSSSKLHDQKDLRTNQSYKSTLFHYLERNSTGMGSEKKFRSTSKVIETIQEKLVSPPTKTAVDRLMRMKEVDSISRIRRLSSKSTDSGEETEEEKIQRRLEGQKRSFGSLNGSDPGHKVEDADTVSKHIISLEENGHHTVHSVKKNAEQDFFCLDTYDPSRVERV